MTLLPTHPFFSSRKALRFGAVVCTGVLFLVVSLVSTAAETSPGAAGAARAGARTGVVLNKHQVESTRIFNEQIAPFLKNYCTECHGEKSTKGDVDLKKLLSQPDLVSNRQIWRSVLKQTESGEMPPDDAKKLPEKDVASSFTGHLTSAIDEAFAALPPDPGAVTMRRLNRLEYNLSVRDIFLTEFNASEAFPSDDIGNGFDNIGSVLTISPIHAERFIDAARAVAQRVLPESLGPERNHVARSIYLAPTPYSNTEPDRPFDNKDSTLSMSDTLPEEGDYRFIVSVSAKIPEGAAPPTLELLVNGTLAGTYTVKAPFKKWENIEVPLHLKGGLHKFSARFADRDTADAERMIFTRSFAAVGPLDRRTRFQRKIAELTASAAPEARPRLLTEWLLTRTFRRPPTEEEVHRYLGLFTDGTDLPSLEKDARSLVTMALCSPHFLFRVESEQGSGPQKQPLNQYQIASRLSYFLWSTTPDEALLSLAAAGTLSQQLEEQVERMLKDPKASTLVSNFGMQWLQLQRFNAFQPDPALFPWDETARRSALKETELFLNEVFLQNSSVMDLVGAEYTFLNEPLARHYGIADTVGNLLQKPKTRQGGTPIRGREFQKVNLTEMGRAGILTHSSVLAVTSNPTRTSPVKRGKWVLEQMLGTPPPPPPPGVPELEDNKEAKGNLRQRMEEHRSKAACANCHKAMDAIGFAFENFDVIGRFRNKDGEDPIDSSGKLPDGSAFSGVGELREILMGKRAAVVRNLAEKLMIYGLGRGLEYYDEPALREITRKTLDSGDRFFPLVHAIVRSDAFLYKRGTPSAKTAGN